MASGGTLVNWEGVKIAGYVDEKYDAEVPANHGIQERGRSTLAATDPPSSSGPEKGCKYGNGERAEEGLSTRRSQVGPETYQE